MQNTLAEKSYIKFNKSQHLEIKKNDNSFLNEQINIQKIALNSVPTSIMITDNHGRIKYVNEAFTKITGYSLDEVKLKNPRILKSNKHDKNFYKNLWETINLGKVWQGELINKRKDGTLYLENLCITPVFDSKNQLTHFIATKSDITEKKKIINDLDETYIKYEELSYIFNNSPAIGFLLSSNHKRSVEFITDNIKQFGYKPEDFYTGVLSFSDFIFPEDREQVLSKVLDEIVQERETSDTEFRIITNNKETRWVDSHFYARLGDNAEITHIQGVLLDITERKKAEEESKIQMEQLMQADKMIALGTLVSGVAHEINNPNNFVMLNIPIIESVWFSILPILNEYYEKNGDFNVGKRLTFSKIKDSMPLLLGGINDGSQRIKNIVEDLKSFARKDIEGYTQNVDLNTVVQTSVNLTANLVSKSTDKFSVKYSKFDARIKGNKQKLEQVLINLIENSCQALTNRKQAIKIETKVDDNYAYIIVNDEGQGIDPSILSKITDPFFTTKRNKGGTGLGLSITSKIIMLHDGKLNFESEINKGTKATLKFPLISSKEN